MLMSEACFVTAKYVIKLSKVYGSSCINFETKVKVLFILRQCKSCTFYSILESKTLTLPSVAFFFFLLMLQEFLSWAEHLLNCSVPKMKCYIYFFTFCWSIIYIQKSAYVLMQIWWVFTGWAHVCSQHPVQETTWPAFRPPSSSYSSQR